MSNQNDISLALGSHIKTALNIKQLECNENVIWLYHNQIDYIDKSIYPEDRDERLEAAIAEGYDKGVLEYCLEWLNSWDWVV